MFRNKANIFRNLVRNLICSGIINRFKFTTNKENLPFCKHSTWEEKFIFKHFCSQFKTLNVLFRLKCFTERIVEYKTDYFGSCLFNKRQKDIKNIRFNP